MRVFILGVDGYLGWTLAQWLVKQGHVIGGADCYNRRSWVAEVGGRSATPIGSMTERCDKFVDEYGSTLRFYKGDLRDFNFVWNMLKTFKPDAIVHLGEQPSAPFSMIDAQHAVLTHDNNVNGTLNVLFAMRDVCPEAHLVKLGSMGEWGTPKVDIPEGEFELEFRGRKATMQFPKNPGSYYHCTKSHDSTNVKLACDIWKLRSTDIMQGVVYGINTWDSEELVTRFDFDAVFGTAVNRFCAQAVVGLPLTPYGSGKQKRGFLPLQDSMQCLTLVLEHPPETGEYRVLNQFEETYSIMELAETVQKIVNEKGYMSGTMIRNLVNPRVEEERHYYNPDRQKLLDMGYVPSGKLEDVIDQVLKVLHWNKDRIAARRHSLVPDVQWSGGREAAVEWES